MRTEGATAENVKQLEFSVPTVFGSQYFFRSEAIFISAPRQFEWFNFQGKATRTEGATAENVKQVELSVPTVFGPQNLIWSELRNERGSDLHLRTTAVRMV